MPQPFANSAYVFNEQINAQYINDLYSGDYEIIAETFADVQAEYPSLLENIAAAEKTGDTAALKKAVHKIKPLFGFTGLITIQSQCVDFEKACDSGQSIDELKPAFNSLSKKFLEARIIIENESTGLALFNSR